VNVTGETLVLKGYFSGFLLESPCLMLGKPYFPNFFSLMLAKSLLYAGKFLV